MEFDSFILTAGDLIGVSVPKTDGQNTKIGGLFIDQPGENLNIATASGSSSVASLRRDFSHLFTAYGSVNSYVSAGASWASDPTKFSIPVGGLGAQLLTVPTSGIYRIELAGGSTLSDFSGQHVNAANGAFVALECELYEGEQVEILCGQSGGWNGSGASYIRIHGGEFLAIAGGAGGHGQQIPGSDSIFRQADARAFFSTGSGLGGSYARSPSSPFLYATGGAGLAGGGGGYSSIKGPTSLSTPIGSRTKGMGGTIDTPITRGVNGGSGGSPGVGGASNLAVGGGGGYEGGNARGGNLNSIAGQGGTCYASNSTRIKTKSVRLRTIAESIANRHGSVLLVLLS